MTCQMSLWISFLYLAGRSSSSSLNNAPPTPKSSAAISNNVNNHYAKRDISVSFKKVSISENNGLETASVISSTPTHTSKLNGVNNVNHVNGSNPSITSSSTVTGGGHRLSLINASSEKKARKVRFFINSDKFFKGATIAVSSEKFRTFDKLIEHLTRIMCNQVTLPQGVRYIFGLDGKAVESVEELLHGSNYVCSSSPTFKRMDYLKVAQEQDNHHWNKMKRETCYLGK